jgi:hypothetical protein
VARTLSPAAAAPSSAVSETAVLAFPAAVRLVRPLDGTVVGEDADDLSRAVRQREVELLDLARARAPDPAIFDENGHRPFFWEAEISSNRLDFYHTRMMPSTLKNFAQNAKEGVSFQNSHDIHQLAIGRSLDGRFKGGQGSGIATTVASFYTVPGLHLNEVTTDNFIDGVRSGILSDVSVGATGGRTVCSICNRDMLDFWDWLFGDGDEEDSCTHFAGVEYTINGEKRVAEGHIEDARLLEVSTVYKGATPNATILKAERAADAGKVPPDLARVLEATYRILLPGVRHVWTGGPHRDDPDRSSAMGDTARDGTTSATPPTSPTTPAQEAPGATSGTPATTVRLQDGARLRATLQAAGFTDAAEATDEELLERLNRYVEDLGTAAADGRRYRTQLIENALTQGQRAVGDGFNTEKYRGILSRLSSDEIQTFYDDWKKQASAEFPGGPRAQARAEQNNTAHRPEGEAGSDQAGTNGQVPASAYRVR